MPARRTLILAAALASSPAFAAPKLDTLFSDHAVLQRDKPIAVRGTADPREKLTITLGDATASARAGKDGRWIATLPARPAGGPYRLAVTGANGASAAAEDILIGDVWLCSGQSNMEYALKTALSGANEVQAANDPQVRIFTVTQRTAISPEASFPAGTRWAAVTPESAADFSAACWFMVRELRADQKVPFGAIDASWGGTRIRPWMDEAAARAGGGAEDAELLSLYRRDQPAAARRFGEQWGTWWRTQSGDAPGQEPWNASNRLTWKPFPATGAWENWGDPAFANWNGYVWARRRITLTAQEAATGATLSLGVIDDLDQSFVNGVGVGSQFGWSNPRDYRLGPGVLKAGENEILINIGDSWGAGGFQGPADVLKLTFANGTVKSLAEGWEYSVVPAAYGNSPRAPWDSHAGLSTIYNGMVAPLGDFGLRGVAWYQGESDVGVPGYDKRLAGMMASWRRQFAAPQLPFLVVSLANFGARAAQPQPSGWAEVRDEQRRAAAADPHAALVIAMDLGEVADIHPPNKQEVGRRLARAARALAYGGTESASGPEAVRARREGNSVLVDFTGVTGALQTLSSAHAPAFELCAETQQSCRWADAVAEGAHVRITSDGKPATRIRFGWGESPITNLYDGAMLPAGPFELPIN
ncbi:MAG TPA: sialate O-acetylesterase [Allosphingosinicella sp.]|jgi:sialate O-acetylesterase